MRYLYLVNYDLIREKDYSELETLLQALNAVRVLFSQWLLVSELTPEAIFSNLRPALDDDDRLLIVEVRKNGFFNKLMIPDARANALFALARD